MTNSNRTSINYILLIISAIIIGYFSPSGIIKALGSMGFMILVTFGIQRIVSSIKPLIKQAADYGEQKLLKSNSVDKKKTYNKFVEGDVVKTFMTLGGFLQILVLNYVIHRYTGFQILDNYIIIFWILVFSGVQTVNYFIKCRRGKKIQNLNHISNVLEEDGNDGLPKFNIISSMIATICLIIVIRNNPNLIYTPEKFLGEVENTVFSMVLSGHEPIRYKTVI